MAVLGLCARWSRRCSMWRNSLAEWKASWNLNVGSWQEKKKKKNKKSQTCFIFCQTMIHCFTQVGFVVLCLLSNVSAPGFSAGVSRHRRAARGASWGQGPLGPGDGCCFFTYQRQAPDPASSLTCMHFPTGGPDGLLMQYWGWLQAFRIAVIQTEGFYQLMSVLLSRFGMVLVFFFFTSKKSWSWLVIYIACLGEEHFEEKHFEELKCKKSVILIF